MLVMLYHATAQWAVIVAIVAFMTFFVIWSRHETRVRMFAVIVFIAAIPISFLAIATSLGWPTPIVPYVTAAPGEEAKVLGYKLVPGVGIFVLLDVGRDPRYYWLPWNAATANKLDEAMHGDKGGRPGAIVVIPYEPSLDENHTPLIHPLPQPKIGADKPRSAPAPHIGDTQ